MSEKLKPCPFCGQNPSHHVFPFTMVDKEIDGDFYESIVKCDSCGAKLSRYSEDARDEAITRSINDWNDREEGVTSLAPCPICGGNPLITLNRTAEQPTEGGWFYEVACETCGVKIESYGDKECIVASVNGRWNNRV